ncbi:hypothetical protein EON76_04630 [bacterium]|nr:MAG: hypothetical protein EON76_04630 [bacterium]
MTEKFSVQSDWTPDEQQEFEAGLFSSKGLSPKSTYMKSEGYLFYSDIGHKFSEEIETLLPTKAKRISGINLDNKLPPTQLNIAAAAVTIFHDVVKRARLTEMKEDRLVRMYRKYHVSTEERDRIPMNIYNKGFDDLEFTFHFAPAVAVNVVDVFLDSGAITQEEYDQLTLGDIADMVGSGWFSDLMHDMALTRNGVYGGYGKEASDYQKLHLESRLADSIEVPHSVQSLFTISEQSASDGFTYKIATLNKTFRRCLRDEMSQSDIKGRTQDSVGCPVARRAGTVAIELAQGKRAKSLVDRSYMHTGELTRSGKQRVHQEYTAIDHALDVTANLLDRYDELYGTPNTGGSPRHPRGIPHEKRQKADCFRYTTETAGGSDALKGYTLDHT